LYNYLSSQWPGTEAFDYKDARPRNRLPIPNGAADVRPLSPAQRTAWSYFGNTVVNEHLKKRIIEKFEPFMRYKFSLISEERFEFIKNNIDFYNYRSDGLNLDFYGHVLLPHIDQSYIYAPIFIYFAQDSDHVHYGTAFYRSKANLMFSDFASINFADCELVKVAPYLPNTMVSFLQNPKGWHGVEPLEHRKYLRKAYHANIMLKPESIEAIYGSGARAFYEGDEAFLKP
jgi:hypothetical protein